MAHAHARIHTLLLMRPSCTVLLHLLTWPLKLAMHAIFRPTGNLHH
jgi:hypothetical protein